MSELQARMTSCVILPIMLGITLYWGRVRMKIASWNVNGLDACRRKGFLKYIKETGPDIVCCQETKVSEQFKIKTPGYTQIWNRGNRPGYSGTLVLTIREPLSYTLGFGIEKFDVEGRLITLEFDEYFVLNVYAPSIHENNSADRPDYRREWDEALYDYVGTLQKPVIMCGDFNAISGKIDAYPQQGKIPDDLFFLPETQDGFRRLLNAGFVDVFRMTYPTKEGSYTWWGPKHKERLEKRGRRLDYFLISEELFFYVQDIQHHEDILGSDHCPISLTIRPIMLQRETSEEDLAVRWRSIDWSIMEDELFKSQKMIAQAAYMRNWDEVRRLEDRLVNSYAAKTLAIRDVADVNSAAGVDGVKFTGDAQKMKAALSMRAENYMPKPNRYMEIVDRGKVINLHIPVAMDKAMLLLYAYALDPVAESTGDNRSFFSRKGRSMYDALTYLTQSLTGADAPKFVFRCDVFRFFSNTPYNWLLKNIPMDTNMLRKFLTAGTIRDNEFFEQVRGISFCSSLSPILGNMLLDGLQTRIYDRLYPRGGTDYKNGSMVRFADDIVVTARSKVEAEKIRDIVQEFLAERGLKFNEKKTYIVSVYDGFTFLSYHFRQKYDELIVEPADEKIIDFEHRLKTLIFNFNGTQRGLIKKINDMLNGFATEYRATDAYYVFRHIDAVVEGLLTDRLLSRVQGKYRRWKDDTIKKKFWIMVNGNPVFALPTDRTVRVIQLAGVSMRTHKSCKPDLNPYLDEEYIAWLKHRRNILKANGKYRSIWQRQGGRCAYCNNPMRPDQEVDVIEKVVGKGWNIKNLMYIHRKCAYDVYSNVESIDASHIDLFDLLQDYTRDKPESNSPYLELREYFRLAEKTPFTLTFREIEDLLGDKLPPEAYLYDAFWFEFEPGMQLPMWKEESYPFGTLILDSPDYCISDTWHSQGYEIKALHRAEERVVFRRTESGKTGLKIPKVLLTQKIPEKKAYELEKLLSQFVKDNGL